MSTSRGRVVGLDVAVSGLLGSHGGFAHHAVTDAMRDQGRVALERVEATHLAEKPLREMSTGERRRVLTRARWSAIRGAAARRAHDRARLRGTAPVHAERAAPARAGTTVVIVTHHIEEVVPEMQRVVLTDRGRVVVDGTPDDVLTPASGPRVRCRALGAPHRQFRIRCTWNPEHAGRPRDRARRVPARLAVRAHGASRPVACR